MRGIVLVVVVLGLVWADGIIRCTDMEGRIWNAGGEKFEGKQRGRTLFWLDRHSGRLVAKGVIEYYRINAVWVDGSNDTAVVSADCLELQWGNHGTWIGVDPTIKKVHVVDMIHLDVGFTRGFRDQCQWYVDEFFCAAINTTRALQKRGGEEMWRITEFPWLILQALGEGDCPVTPPSPQKIALLEKALSDGDVLWQGNSLNVFPELMWGAHYSYSLTLAEKLRKRFNKTWGIAAKSTDVPGMSRAVVSILAKHGVRALHIGYNGACRVPEIPTTFFWQDVATNSSILVFVENGYGVGIRNVGDEALAFNYGIDNSAPPTPEQVIENWAVFRTKYPNAQIVSSSLDDFALFVLNASTSLHLPVITSEIGDSWLYGAPAHPQKLAAYRQRIAQGAVGNDSFALHMLKGPPEHNWGLSVGQYAGTILGTDGNWSNALFWANRNQSVYAALEAEWKAQLDWTLAGSSMVASEPVFVAGNCSRWTWQVGPEDGALISLVDGWSSNRQWASINNPIGELRYETFDWNNFQTFNAEYNPGCGPPCGDFSKIGLDSASPVRGTHAPHVTQVIHVSPCQVTVELAFDANLSVLYGAPQNASLSYSFDNSFGVGITVNLDAKPATRLPEALWLRLNPLVTNASQWEIHVLESWISPNDVVVNGTATLHAVWQGVRNAPDGLKMATLDAALVR